MMKVLFIAKEGYEGHFKPVVQNQFDSLKQDVKDVEFLSFPISGRGLLSYVKTIIPLRAYLRKNNPDMIHAHYSFSGFVAGISVWKKPIIMSLMGSDVEAKFFFRLVIKLFARFIWNETIVKSRSLKQKIDIENLRVIPNGVDFNVFRPLNQIECKEKLGWDITKKQILFAANPDRPEKNYKLAKEAFENLNNHKIELKILNDVPAEQMPIYHNAADVVLLTSKWEGSPNVIKEAMACNRPVVATNVGDIKWLFGETEGCFLVSNSPVDVSDKINKAIIYKETQARARIDDLGISSVVIANRLINLYENII